MKKRMIQFLCSFILAGICSADERGLLLSQVYDLIDRQSPELQASRAALAGVDGAVKQGRFLPNPEVEIELEDFGREAVEILVTQEIEFGDRRGSRVRATLAERAIAEGALESATLRMRAEAMGRFGAVIAAQQKVELVDSLLTLARTTRSYIEYRVEVGAAMAIDRVRSETAEQEMELKKRSLQSEYLIARKHLAVLWGDPGDVDWEPIETFVSAPVEISPEELKRAVEEHPDLRVLTRSIHLLQEELAMERAAALPNLSLGAGFLHDRVANESTSLFRASISLPVFSRNQGAVFQKSHEVEQAERMQHSAFLTRWSQAEQVMSEMAILTERIRITEESILPNSERILAVLTDYYRQGSVGILEVLDAQQSLMEKMIEHTEDLGERARLAASLMALAGTEYEVIR